MTTRRPATLRPLAMMALLVALLLRAGIPAGYMLAPTDGLPRIVPCPGTAPAMPHHHGGQHDQRAEVPCAFALVAPPALPGTSHLLAPQPPLPALVPPAAVALAAPYLRAVLPPPATGPPFV